jgi:hypothetical protein
MRAKGSGPIADMNTVCEFSAYTMSNRPKASDSGARQQRFALLLHEQCFGSASARVEVASVSTATQSNREQPPYTEDQRSGRRLGGGLRVLDSTHPRELLLQFRADNLIELSPRSLISF